VWRASFVSPRAPQSRRYFLLTRADCALNGLIRRFANRPPVVIIRRALLTTSNFKWNRSCRNERRQ
jgi:hypothetical protein